MDRYLLIFNSLTTAQHAGQVLRRAGVRCSVGKAPRDTAYASCRYAVSIDERDYERAVDLLYRAGLAPNKIIAG